MRNERDAREGGEGVGWGESPPCTNFVLLEDVPAPKSSLSTRAVRKPRVAASKAIPVPVAPPPITRRSKGEAGLLPARADTWTWRGGTSSDSTGEGGGAGGGGGSVRGGER